MAFVYANPRLHHIARVDPRAPFVVFCQVTHTEPESNGQPVRVAANLYFSGDRQS